MHGALLHLIRLGKNTGAAVPNILPFKQGLNFILSFFGLDKESRIYFAVELIKTKIIKENKINYAELVTLHLSHLFRNVTVS